MSPAWLARLRVAIVDTLRRDHPAAELSELVPFGDGRSGVTLTARLSGFGVDRDVRDVIVKATPEGRRPVGRHDVLRQADVLDALAPVDQVPAPRVLARVSGDVTCVVMERCAGDVVEPVLDAATRVLPAALVGARARRAARMLAALHTVDLGASPVMRSVRPADLSDEMERWSATAAAADPADAPRIGDLATRLRAAMPDTPGPPVLVHGDYRLGNIVFDGTVPTGVIDWEIWGVTGAGVDLGWFLVFCDADAFPGIGRPVVGMPTADELLDVYREAGGVVPDDIVWFDAFGRFKMAAIMAHNLRRHREGRHVDPFQERLPPTIVRLIETGLERLGSPVAR